MQTYMLETWGYTRTRGYIRTLPVPAGRVGYTFDGYRSGMSTALWVRVYPFLPTLNRSLSEYQKNKNALIYRVVICLFTNCLDYHCMRHCVKNFTYWTAIVVIQSLLSITWLTVIVWYYLVPSTNTLSLWFYFHLQIVICQPLIIDISKCQYHIKYVC